MGFSHLQAWSAAPVLNTPNFSEVFGGKDGNLLLTDQAGHIRALEFVALPNMIFEIVSQTAFPYIYMVSCAFYNSSKLYVDSRFFSFIKKPKQIIENLAIQPKNILDFLEKSLGHPYLWGGNFLQGNQNILLFYPPATSSLPLETLDKWQLKGADCSGLLYEITNGTLPRNTSELLNFGKGLEIQNLSAGKMLPLLKPLDLIVFKGHVIIVFDKNYTIESREFKGVVKTPIKERFEELLLTKKPANVWSEPTDFVIRRWI